MSAHPRDEWVEFRTNGSAEPILFLLIDGREVELAEAKAAFVHDHIDVAELERRVSAALGLSCPCGCGHQITDHESHGLALLDQRHSELVFQGKPPLPGFVPGVGHTYP